jgi:nitrate/TMAO reductase-like tetraheme cytochrome c subunit
VHQATTGSDCSRCHTPSSWLVNNITNLHQISRFPLVGAHKTADCFQCHKSESLARYDVPGIDCIDCHRHNYVSTTAPNHASARFSEDCSICHPVNSFQWTGAGFNHNFFALVQGHASPACAECHTTGLYSDANPECVSCHQTDYNSTTNPNHTASSFPVTCQNCHTLAPGWKPASFNHNAFPLTLGHAGPTCIDCHKNGNYSTTPTDCYSCHQTDYNNTSNPKHQTLGFSTVCTQCHTTNPDWKPASYREHDAKSFPIYSGKHRGEWTNCSECHTNTSNYSVFSCLNCHEHNKASMDSKHRGENGYSYDSASCLKCHPTGKAD